MGNSFQQEEFVSLPGTAETPAIGNQPYNMMAPSSPAGNQVLNMQTPKIGPNSGPSRRQVPVQHGWPDQQVWYGQNAGQMMMRRPASGIQRPASGAMQRPTSGT